MDLPRIRDTARRLISGLWPSTGLVRFIVGRFYAWDLRPCPDWKSSRLAGRYGEAVAARHLVRAGLRVLVRNFQARGGEIDLIVRHGRELVMVEVKTRHSRAKMAPEHSVTWSKQRKIIATANAYLRELPGRPPPVRFDIVEVLYEPHVLPRVRWIRGAFSMQDAGFTWSR
ncbi:MAG: YraN family protein [Verrucomicrobia bacterium]|nr:YraN family protein [Verrucomicrobiota bacterium]